MGKKEDIELIKVRMNEIEDMKLNYQLAKVLEMLENGKMSIKEADSIIHEATKLNKEYRGLLKKLSSLKY